jgi:hypothetical protein
VGAIVSQRGNSSFNKVCYETDAGPDPDGESTICFLTIKPLDTPLGQGQPQLLALIDFNRHLFAKPRFDGHDVRRSTGPATRGFSTPTCLPSSVSLRRISNRRNRRQPVAPDSSRVSRTPSYF